MSDSNTYRLRLSLWRRLEHHATALLFAVLTVTGLAQKFHDSGWAEWVIFQLGGIDSSRGIHRVTGLLFTLILMQHIIVAVAGVWARGWKPSMVITTRDFQDALTNLRYYLGLVDQPARCDRFDYRQKFEYWGVVTGGLLMIVTGLVLWFPVLFFELFPFFPGQVIPAAKAVHTNEAVLALSIIVVWHIYNAVFSPEVFPLDTTIFTGRISVQRMKHEHPLEWERMTGKLGPSWQAAEASKASGKGEEVVAAERH